MNRALAAIGLVGLLVLGAFSARADEPDRAELEAMAERLALARQGELADSEPVWLHVWELPGEVQQGFTPPRFAMRVSGDDPYVMVGGRIRRPGDQAGGYTILAIEAAGIVLDVDGYPVLVE